MSTKMSIKIKVHSKCNNVSSVVAAKIMRHFLSVCGVQSILSRQQKCKCLRYDYIRFESHVPISDIHLLVRQNVCILGLGADHYNSNSL
jgi:hypothetical protein